MPRVARVKSESGIYHIIMRGINRQTLFEDEEVYTKYIPNIYVLNKGNIIGQGSHEQLIESCSMYKTLVNSQGKIRGDAYDVC